MPEQHYVNLHSYQAPRSFGSDSENFYDFFPSTGANHVHVAGLGTQVYITAYEFLPILNNGAGEVEIKINLSEIKPNARVAMDYDVAARLYRDLGKLIVNHRKHVEIAMNRTDALLAEASTLSSTKNE
jgi:hypothetical protein